MKLQNILIVLGLCLFSITACSEEPNSPVAPIKGTDTDDKPNTNDEDEKVLALKFVGVKINETGLPQAPVPCSLYLAVDEEEHAGEEDGDHHHGLLMTMDYTEPDGHKPHAGEAEFFLFDENDKKYYDLDSNKANTAPVLSSVSVVEEHNGDKEIKKGEPTKLVDYITAGVLDQSIHIDLDPATNTEEFVETLEEVLEGKKNLADVKVQLNMVTGIKMILIHGDHPHYPKCHKLKADSLEEVEFETGHDHDH